MSAGNLAQARGAGLGDRVPNRVGEARAQDIANLEREAYARSLAQMRAQNWRASRNVSRPARSGGRRR
jgi:hypothetical protein